MCVVSNFCSWSQLYKTLGEHLFNCLDQRSTKQHLLRWTLPQTIQRTWNTVWHLVLVVTQSKCQNVSKFFLFKLQVVWLDAYGAPWLIMPMTTVWLLGAWCWPTTVSFVQTTSHHARAARTTNTSMLAGALSALKVGLVLFHAHYNLLQSKFNCHNYV